MRRIRAGSVADKYLDLLVADPALARGRGGRKRRVGTAAAFRRSTLVGRRPNAAAIRWVEAPRQALGPSAGILGVFQAWAGRLAGMDRPSRLHHQFGDALPGHAEHLVELGRRERAGTEEDACEPRARADAILAAGADQRPTDGQMFAGLVVSHPPEVV
ncbi:MAG: hypothetical protein AMXMBFR64_29410 [Myxococcales bacterium]